jgi:hypothetical protein
MSLSKYTYPYAISPGATSAGCSSGEEPDPTSEPMSSHAVPAWLCLWALAAATEEAFNECWKHRTSQSEAGHAQAPARGGRDHGCAALSRRLLRRLRRLGRRGDRVDINIDIDNINVDIDNIVIDIDDDIDCGGRW